MTSDNVSPIHLMDIKRVAFETKSVRSPESRVQSPGIVESQESRVESKNTQPTKRAEIAALVDKFLSQKLAETPVETVNTNSAQTIGNPKSAIQNQTASPVKTIIHELKPPVANGNGAKSKAVEFVSEEDVKKAIAGGAKIYVTAKTIITPSARDLGEEKEIFAKI